MSLPCPNCDDLVPGGGVGDEEYMDGHEYACVGCGLLWLVDCDGERAWIAPQPCQCCGAEEGEDHRPKCRIVEIDRLRSSLSAAEKDLADLRAALKLAQDALGRTVRAAESEVAALRSELASLKAPADRFDAEAAAAQVRKDLDWLDYYEGTLRRDGIIANALRTAYHRGAQDQGAEIERLRGALLKYGEHLFVDRDGVVFDLEKQHAARYQDFNRCPDQWANHCACGLTEALSPAPASSASPVDSLTGEAQEGHAAGCSLRHVNIQVASCACARKAWAGIKPVEAEQPKHVLDGGVSDVVPTCGHRDMWTTHSIGGRRVTLCGHHDCACATCNAKVEAEQPKELTRAVAIAPMVAFGGEQPKPAAESCVRCGGTRVLIFSNPDRGPMRWTEPCPACGGDRV